MKRLTMAAALACCLLGAQGLAVAAPANLDRSFGEGGIVDLVKAPAERFPGANAYAIDVAPGPDESVFVLARGAECAPGARCDYSLIVTRYAADGSPDTAYGERGSTMVAIADYSGQEAHIAVDSQGRALVAAKSGDAVRVTRLGVDGGRDGSFGGGGETVAPACSTR